jgi:acetyl-CoA carboxylase biotin carboxyl carrier protein
MSAEEEAAMDSAVEPVAVGPGDPGEPARPAIAPVGPTAADASLLALVDRLTAVLERSDLGELEVSAGGTTIVLRSPAAIERPVAVAGPGGAPEPGQAQPSAAPATGSGADAPVPVARPAVKAPLTGIYYGAPSPGATAYVTVGDQVAVGQLIGLIEAMKLFNEIKSDLAGRVVRVCVESGALVKAKQPLIEVEPL